MAEDEVIVGLDIGTTKVCAMIGERNEKGLLQITGVGVAPSTGLRKGVVVNIEATLRSIAAAVQEAENMAGREVRTCWAGIGGNHIDGINSRGVVAVTGKNGDTREIGEDDIARVLEAARAVAIPMDRQVLEVIPQSYIVDDQKGIRDPLDMIGVRLEAEVHIITCSVNSAQNLVKCINRADLTVDELVLQSLAASRSVLTPEEREMGVALIDLGGGTTDVLVYADGAPYSNATIPAGGTLITSDISKVKNISIQEAEHIKVRDGCCWEDFLEDDEDIIVPMMGGRPPLSIPRSQLLAIIQPRMEEILRMVKDRLDKLPISRPLGGGVVLTGGGAQLLGVAELAAHIFRLPVRVGNTLPVGGLGLNEKYRNPIYATALGLVLEGDERENRGTDVLDRGGEARPRERKGPTVIGRIIDWMKNELF